MEAENITDKEFAVIREISNHQQPTQRHIAEKAGISLGLTNLIIKRLIKKGYIKIREVPPRTIMYMLTPKGLAEKTKKSYHFTLRTINSIRTIKENIQDLITREYAQGAREFTISGAGELAVLVEIVFRGLNLKNIRVNSEKIRGDSCLNEPLCNLLITVNGERRKIDILSELSKM